MKQFKHIGAYGIILENNKIVLIKKVGGPYNGKLDLPGGTIEWGETTETTLEWTHKGELEQGHHIGFFYKIKKYQNEIKKNISINDINDDSLGAEFYEINKLKKRELSDIAKLEIEKLGYKLID